MVSRTGLEGSERRVTSFGSMLRIAKRKVSGDNKGTKCDQRHIIDKTLTMKFVHIRKLSDTGYRSAPIHSAECCQKIIQHRLYCLLKLLCVPKVIQIGSV